LKAQLGRVATQYLRFPGQTDVLRYVAPMHPKPGQRLHLEETFRPTNNNELKVANLGN
jgi:hypothetical protein